jgi:hypothetical protein
MKKIQIIWGYILSTDIVFMFLKFTIFAGDQFFSNNVIPILISFLLFTLFFKVSPHPTDKRWNSFEFSKRI